MTFMLVIPDIAFPKLSNEFLLQINIGLFLAFVIAEIIGAVISNSLSLLGDAACMSVDILSYVCNIYVEWYKKNTGRFDSQSSYTFEIIIPTLSVLSLLAVTLYITVDAVKLLMNPPSVDDVDVDYLYAYSVVNLVVDSICSGLFYLKGEETFLENHDIPKLSLDTSVACDSEDEFGFLDEDGEIELMELNAENQSSTSSHGRRNNEEHSVGFFGVFCCSAANSSGDIDSTTSAAASTSGSSRKNLNMMTAFMHVLGDSLRTVSVFAAALVSTLTGIDVGVCDAWAAVVVTVTILVLCMHIMREIYLAAVDIRLEHQMINDDGDQDDSGGRHLARRTLVSGGGGSRKGRYAPVRNEDDDAVV